MTSIQLGFILAETYLRCFWYLIVGIPIMGILLLTLGPNFLKPLGILMIAWPLVLPARARFVSFNLARSLRKPTVFSTLPDWLLFAQGPQTGLKLSVRSVRSVLTVQKHLVFITHKFKVTVPLPITSLEEGQAQSLISAFGPARYSPEEQNG